MLTKNKGYSLIELMFVIIVIAVLLLMLATSERQKSRQSLIETTNIEMQNWLQAVASYYMDNSQWPKDEDVLLEKNTYLPASAQCSSWPTTSSTNPLCPAKAQYQLFCPGEKCDPKTAKYYGVSILIPTLDYAAELAALLPSAEIYQHDDRGYTVAAFIPIPAAVSNSYTQQAIAQGWIASAGVLRAGAGCGYAQRIYLPNCPEGYEGHYVQMYQRQRTGGPTGKPGPTDKCQDSYSDHPYIGFEFKQLELNKENPYVVTRHLYSKDRRQFQYNYYLTMCIPNGHWQIKKHNKLTKHAKQCKGLWKEYNPGSKCDG